MSNLNSPSLTKTNSSRNIFDIVKEKLTPKKSENEENKNSLTKPIPLNQSPAVTPQKSQTQNQTSNSPMMDKTLFFSSIDASVVIGKDLNSSYLNSIEPQLHVLNKKTTLTNKEKPKKTNFNRDQGITSKFIDNNHFSNSDNLSSDSISPSASYEDFHNQPNELNSSTNNLLPQQQTTTFSSFSPQPNQIPSSSSNTNIQALNQQQPKVQSQPQPKTQSQVVQQQPQQTQQQQVQPQVQPQIQQTNPQKTQSQQNQQVQQQQNQTQKQQVVQQQPIIQQQPPQQQQTNPQKTQSQQNQQVQQQHEGPYDELPFQLSEIPIGARLYLDHLKTENYELKRQLNIVLEDNAEQREHTLNLQNIVKELEEYTDQQDGWVSELRTELIVSTELLLNHHQKIDNLSEILTGCDEQKDQFHSLYTQSQELLQKTEEDNLNLNSEVLYLKDLTNQLDKQVLDLNKEIKKSQEFKIETIIYRIQNGIEPSGIEKLKSFQDKDTLLQESVRIYNQFLEEDVLLAVIIFLRNTLHWTVFIQLLRNHRESLDYFIRYCKLTKNFNDLKLVYRDTHNTLEEGFILIRQAAEERDVDVKYSKLEDAVKYFENYPHLYSQKEIVVNYLNSKKTGITLSTQDFHRQFMYQQQLQFANNYKK